MSPVIPETAVSKHFLALESFLIALYLGLRIFSGGPEIELPGLEVPLGRAFILALLGVVSMRIAVLGTLRLPSSRLLAALGLYTAVLLGGAATGLQTGAGMERFWFFMEAGALLLVLGTRREGEGLRTLALGSAIAAFAATAVYGVFQKSVSLPDTAGMALEGQAGGLASLPWGRDRLMAGEPFGTFVTSNVMAGFMLLFLPAATALSLSAFRNKRRLEGALMGGVATAAFLVLAWSGSKGAWVGLAVAGPAALYTWFRYGKATTGVQWLVVGGATVAATVGAAVSGPLSSLGIRGGYWLGALKALAAHPLGTGPGAFGTVYPQFRPEWGMETRFPHSAFVDALVSGGPMLLVTFLYLLHRIFVSSESAFPPEAKGEGAKAPDAISGETTFRFASLTALLGLLGGWAFEAARSGGLGGGYIMGFISSPASSGAAKALAAAAVPIALIAVFPATVRLLGTGGTDAATRRPTITSGLACGTAGFFVHASVEILWQVPGLVLSVLTAAAWMENAPPREKTIRGAFPRVLAAMILIPLALIFALLVLRPLEGIEAARDARLANLALASLERLKEARRAGARPPDEHILRILETLEPQERATALKNISEGRFRPLEKALAEKALSESFRCMRIFPRDDRFPVILSGGLLRAAGASPVFRRQLLDASEELFLHAEKIAPWSSRTWSLGGRIAFARGEKGTALARFYAATKYYPASPLKWLTVGDAALLAGAEWRALAVRAYQISLQLNTTTLEEKSSLYTLAYYPGLLPWPPTGLKEEFFPTLAATIGLISAQGTVTGTAPILFRAALEDLRLGRRASAAESFRALSRYYTGKEQTSMKVFLWLSLLMEGHKEKAAEIEEDIKSLVSNSRFLIRLKNRAEEALRWKRLHTTDRRD